MVANGVLEHIPPDLLTASLAEINRILLPGGKLFTFYTPRKRSYVEWLARVLKIWSHDILFDDIALRKILIDCGYDIEFMDVHDMLIRGGLKLQWFLNMMEPVTRVLDNLLLKTPVRVFAHHIACCAKKPLETP